MVPEFNGNIVLVSYGVTFTSLYVALCAAEQLRGEFLNLRNQSLFKCNRGIVAVLINSNDRLYAKRKTEILEIFVESII